MRPSMTYVNAFTPTPFAGNPAAVCILSAPASDAWMQEMAQETNQPATAFLWTDEEGYQLRWFTPTTELNLCGHGTLSAAHVLWSETTPEVARLELHTKSGLLTATREGEWITLNFPIIDQAPAEAPQSLLSGLHVPPLYVGRNTSDSYVALLETEAQLRQLAPDFSQLAQMDARGVIVTAQADDPSGPFDFVSRFFAPGLGIYEDSVTGSAHCCLAPFWSQRLQKTEMVGFQASKRGGVVRMNLRGDRVFLAGQAVTTLRGELSRIVA